MNLSSLVHAGRQHVDHFESYSTRPHHIMASSLVANPYPAQPLGANAGYAYVPAHHHQPPPSPPVDEVAKCSLPSISSLLGLADGSSPQEQPSQAKAPAAKSEYPPDAAPSQYGRSPVTASRGALPPTPPMQSDTGYDGQQSPSTASNSGYSVASASGYYFAPPAASVHSNSEPHAQRQPGPPPPQRRVSMPPASMGYAPSPYNASQYAASPQPSMDSYYPSPLPPTTPAPSHISGLYYQRPLPQQFPPPMMPISVTVAPSSGANPWQHHHYISPSSAASFPQSQDRYICQTCNKAFSRPSSLRIHSHSHTGEKPFKCPHQGCGRAFSVRSNMKRHERGCHSFESGTMM